MALLGAAIVEAGKANVEGTAEIPKVDEMKELPTSNWMENEWKFRNSWRRRFKLYYL